MEKQIAVQAIRDGMKFKEDLKKTRSDQSAEDMHLDERAAIQERGDQVVPIEAPNKLNMEEFLRDAAKTNQRKINRARGFAPKGMRNIAKVSTDAFPPAETASRDNTERQEAITKLAWEQFRNRKSIDPNNKETEPSEFDLRAAEFAYDAVNGQGKTEKTFYPPVVVSPSERERAVVSTKPEVIDAESKPEDLQQAELNKAITDFEAKQAQIAAMRASKTGRFASLAKTLGIKTKDLSNDPEVMSLEKESQDLYRDLLSKGIHLYKGDKPQLENFLQQFDEFEIYSKNQNQEMDERAKAAGFPENILAGMHKIGKKWSEMNKWQKLGIGAAGGLAIAGGGLLLGAGTFGAASLGFGWRWGFRAFGAISAGVGRHMQLDKNMMKEIEKSQEGVLQSKLDILKRWGDNIDDGIEEILAKSPTLSVMRERDYEKRSLENNRRARNLALKSFVISSIVGESLRASGINFGSVLKKAGGFIGFGSGVAENTATSAVEHSLPSGGAQTFSHEELSQIQKALEDARPGKGIDDLANEINKPQAGAIINESANMPESEAKVGGIIPEAESGPKPGSGIASPETPSGSPIETLQESSGWKEIGEETIKGKGKMADRTIEGVAAKIIRANPEQFHLDPSDPQLKIKAGQEAHRLARGLATKYGVSYEELNDMVSKKVQAGDVVRIYNDPTTGKFNMTYKGAALNEIRANENIPKVSQVVPAQEIPSGKSNIVPEEISRPRTGVSPEDLRPRAGVADHQSVRGGQVNAPQEFVPQQKVPQDYWSQVAQADQELNTRHIEEVSASARDLAMANNKAFLATRGLWNRVFEGAGFSKHGDVWSGSAHDVYDQIIDKQYIVHDVIDADAVKNLNENNIRLMALFMKFGEPAPGVSMAEYMRGIVSNSANIPILNTFKSLDIEKLIERPIK